MRTSLKGRAALSSLVQCLHFSERSSFSVWFLVEGFPLPGERICVHTQRLRAAASKAGSFGVQVRGFKVRVQGLGFEASKVLTGTESHCSRLLFCSVHLTVHGISALTKCHKIQKFTYGSEVTMNQALRDFDNYRALGLTGSTWDPRLLALRA